MSRWQLGAAVLLLLLQQSSFAGDSSKTPRFVVNLLDYVAADYSGAVSGGKILSASEYKEQLEFVESALDAVKSGKEYNAEIIIKVEALQSLIKSKASSDTVSLQAQSAKADVIRVTGMQVAPVQWPNLKRAEVLFAQNCATCHGVTGHGDGVAAAHLNPPPANFHSQKMKELSPFKAFNAIRVGVPGTPMVAWNSLTDQNVWDLSFYVLSLRHGVPEKSSGDSTQLLLASTHSDLELMTSLPGSEKEKKKALTFLRTQSGNDGDGGSLGIARASLKDSDRDFKSGDLDSAKANALKAYLEGVEPAEPKLRANDPAFTAELEEKMAAVRGAIEARKSYGEFSSVLTIANQSLDQADLLLAHKASSPGLVFMISAGILLREGFEAVLILVALLAVIRKSGARRAELWVHGGWITALCCGVLAWIFSGWLMGISGAQRELMEAFTSIFAVLVLLYMGFWLHSKTEIGRWTAFIDTQVKTALEGSNLIGLATISFMAVFREAFETVLFLRAVWLDGGDAEKNAMLAGVFGSLVFIFICSWILLKTSAKIPLRKVFSASSILMILLSVILAGKGIHSLQETGWSPVTATAFIRWEVLGIYPTLQTLVVQAVVLALAVGLWFYGKRTPQVIKNQGPT